jgi:hypothetical protein
MAFVRGMASSSQTLGASYYADVNELDTIRYARDALNCDTRYASADHPSTSRERIPSMSRLGRLFRSRITLALLGVALVGGGGAVWAVTTGAHSTPQASSSLSNQDPTSSASAEDPTTTTTTDPGATATTPPARPSSTPRPTATSCLATPTPVPINQSVHWQGRVVRVSPNPTPPTLPNFVLAVGCGRPTIAVDGNTSWPGQAKSLSDMSAGWVAEVEAISQGNGTYQAKLVNAQPDN